MSKTRQRRIFGMSLTQILILGCLALVAIATIFGGFIYLSSTPTPGDNSILPSLAPTYSLQPTNMADLGDTTGGPFSIPTFTSDGKIPSNWQSYSSTTIEISVPPQFESINADIERQHRVESYRVQGYGFLADLFDSPSFDYRFWFNFPQPVTVPYITHIIVKADILPTFTLNEYVDQVYGSDLQGFQLFDRQEIAIDTLEAQRVLLESDLGEVSIGMAEYVITDEVNLWVISCGSIREEFDSWLPEFDQVARSFRLLY